MRYLSAVLVFLGVSIGGYFIGNGLEKFNRNERSISVRGLAEKQVKANIAVWKINFNVSSDRMEQVRMDLPVIQKTIQDFLIENGLDASEISKSSSIKDRQAQEYGSEKGFRFVASGIYKVTSDKVDQVSTAKQKIDELLKKGVVITSDQVDFHFTNLNQIKPEMLDQATVNAKEAALGFAKSMDVHVGKLKSASQGVFSIESPIGDEDYGGSQSSLMKKVRVVTQVEFYIQ